MSTPNEIQIREKLSRIPVPGRSENIIDAGIVEVAEPRGETAFVKLTFSPETARHRRIIEAQVRNGLRALGFAAVEVEVEGAVDAATPGARLQAPPGRPQPHPRAEVPLLEEVRHIVAVASGKGGVGKSTVAVNLACAMAKAGKRVGILDADVYGPNIPMMFGLEGKRPAVENNKVVPLTREGIKIMSLGFLAPRDEAIIWRGPLVGRAIEQMLRDVDWGALDFLILDLPPGTGDAQLTISQRLELAGAVMVSTPQPVALSDALKGLRMFQKVNVPVLGLVENMSVFVCDQCGKEHDIFGKGGVERAAAQEKVPFLGTIPLTPELRTGGDEGKPVVLNDPDSLPAQRFVEIAGKIVAALGESVSAPAAKRFTF